MSHQQIIQTLIEWIDEHIDQPLNIDVVAKIRLLEVVFTADVPHGDASDAGRLYSSAPTPAGRRRATNDRAPHF